MRTLGRIGCCISFRFLDRTSKENMFSHHLVCCLAMRSQRAGASQTPLAWVPTHCLPSAPQYRRRLHQLTEMSCIIARIVLLAVWTIVGQSSIYQPCDKSGATAKKPGPINTKLNVFDTELFAWWHARYAVPFGAAKKSCPYTANPYGHPHLRTPQRGCRTVCTYDLFFELTAWWVIGVVLSFGLIYTHGLQKAVTVLMDPALRDQFCCRTVICFNTEWFFFVCFDHVHVFAHNKQ